MTIKINNAAKIAKCGKFPRTFAAVLAAIPAEVIDSLTAKNLASLADAMDAQFKAGQAASESDVEAALPTEIASEVAVAIPAPAPVQYFVYNAFDVRDDMIRAGALWIPSKKAWLITKKMFEKFEARTGSWGMAWVKGWAKTRVEEIAG